MYAGAGGGRRTNSSSTSSSTSEIPGTDGGRRYVLHPRGWSQLCSADIKLTYLLITQLLWNRLWCGDVRYRPAAGIRGVWLCAPPP